MSINDNKSNGGDSFFAVQTGLLLEFDTFVADCRDFIDQFYAHQQKQPASVASKLAFWSNRKLGSRLQKLLNSLNKREEHFDAHLRSMMDDSLTNVSSLTLQAAHLKSRLASCINFNMKEMELLGTQMGELQGLSHGLSRGDKDTKDILHFVNEIMAQGEAQSERNMVYFSVDPDTKELVGFTTKDRSLVIRRLHMIREVQGQTSHIFSEILELYKKHQGTLRICQASYNLLCEVPSEVVYDLRYEAKEGGMRDNGSNGSCSSSSGYLSLNGNGNVGHGEEGRCPQPDKKADHLIGVLEKYFLQPDEKLNILLTSPSSRGGRKTCPPSAGGRRDRTGSRERGGVLVPLERKEGTDNANSECSAHRPPPIPSTPPYNHRDNHYASPTGSPAGDLATVFSNGERGDCCGTSSFSVKAKHSNGGIDRETIGGIGGKGSNMGAGHDWIDKGQNGSSGRHNDGPRAGMEEQKCEKCEEKGEEAIYDHTQCCDCSVVDDLSRDCVARLSAMHRKAAESFGRLEKLLEIREDLININMCIRARKTF